jgi:hypothetical protein
MERQPNHGDEQQPDGNAKQPEHTDRQDEQRFYFGPWVFNINRAQVLIAERVRPTLYIPVAAWARVYGFDHPEDERRSISLIAPGPGFDHEYAMTTELSEPVILATIHSDETGMVAPLLIDGTHRLYRAYVEGVPELPAHLLNTEETLAIREDRR